MPSRDYVVAIIKHRSSNGPLHITRAVGVSHYQSPLMRFCGQPNGRQMEFHCLANLFLHHENEYDSNAVRVDIHGKTVGHLDRLDAVKYRKKMRACGLGYVTLAVYAMIFGGAYLQNGTPYPYTVDLFLDLRSHAEWFFEPIPGRPLSNQAMTQGNWGED